MKLTKLKMAVLGALLVPTMSVIAEEAATAASEAPKSDFSFSGNVGIFSDYIFRGYTQTKHQPAIQGGFDVEHSSGLYAGTWASNVEWTTQSGVMSENSIEMDFYAGYATELAGFGIDVGVLQYYYPGDYVDGLKIDSDATEVYAGISKDIGPVSASLKVYSVVSDEAWQFADMKGETYTTLDLEAPLGPITASLHVGYQTFGTASGSDLDYTDWKVNVEYPLNDTFAIGAFYTDTDMDKNFWTYNGEFLGEAVGGGYLSASF